MTSTLTTPERVRNRMGYSDATLTNQIIQEYIDDATAYIQRVARKTFTPADPLYELARSVCTDLATAYAIVRPAGGVIDGLDYTIDELKVKKSEQTKSRQRTVEKFIRFAEKGLEQLQDDDTDYPQSNTGPYG